LLDVGIYYIILGY